MPAVAFFHQKLCDSCSSQRGSLTALPLLEGSVLLTEGEEGCLPWGGSVCPHLFVWHKAQTMATHSQQMKWSPQHCCTCGQCCLYALHLVILKVILMLLYMLLCLILFYFILIELNLTIWQYLAKNTKAKRIQRFSLRYYLKHCPNFFMSEKGILMYFPLN